MNKKRNPIIRSLLFGMLAAGILFFTQGVSAEAKDGYFVGIDDSVYFRKYGKEALQKTALWGEYFNYPTEEGGSFVAAYHKDSGNARLMFKDDGGKLYYDNQRFYFEARAEDKDYYNTVVYEIEKNGDNPRILAEYATILGLSDSGCLAVKVVEPEGRPAIEVFKDGNQLLYIGGPEDQGDLQYIGIVGDYLLYGVPKYDYMLMRMDIFGMDLAGTSDAVKLGSLDFTGKIVDGVDIGNVVWKKGKAYFSAFYAEGTGHFISEGFVYRVDPKKKNSLKAVTGDISKKYQKIPVFSVDRKGKVKFSEYRKNEVFTEGNSVYLFKSDKDKKRIVKDIRKLFGSSQKASYAVAAAEYIDGAVYMIVNKQRREESEDVGWREAYRVLERYYVRLPLKGGTKSMQILYKDKF